MTTGLTIGADWRLLIEFRAGASWCGQLFSPAAVSVASWTGKKTADELVEAASGYLDVLKLPDEARQLRRHWQSCK